MPRIKEKVPLQFAAPDSLGLAMAMARELF